MRKQSTEQSIRLSELRVDNGGREGRGAEELYVDSISNGTHSELPRITPINGNSAHGIAAFLCSSSNVARILSWLRFKLCAPVYQ